MKEKREDNEVKSIKISAPTINIKEQELKEKISKIKVGTTFNNYKDLCKTIDIVPETGSGKKKQIKELERYMELRTFKNKQNIKVRKIYKNIKPSEPPENAVYISAIQLTLLQYMKTVERSNKLTITTNKLMNNIGMVNNNWQYNQREKILKIIEDKNIIEPIQEVKEWQATTAMRLKQLIKRAMEDMKKRYIIDYDTHLMIIKQIENKKTKETQLTFEKATEEERSRILKKKRKIMIDMGYQKSDNIPYIRLGEFHYKFKKELEKESMIIYTEQSIIEQKIINTYDEYDIYFNKEFLQEEIIEINKELKDNIEIVEAYKIEETKLAETKNNLNNKIINKLLQASDSKKRNNDKITVENINKNKVNIKQLSDSYTDNCKDLIELFIDLKGSLYNFLKVRGYSETEINQIIEISEINQ